MTQSMSELYILQLMFIGQHILTSPLMKSQVTGSFNVFSQMSQSQINQVILVQLGLSLIPVLVVIYCHLTFTKKIHPQVSVKDLHKTIDKRVCLEAYNKSEIKQLGTCCLTMGHDKNAKSCHFYIVPDYCRLILGLNDVHSLSLVVIKCDMTDK